jgi:hypothetical protein
MKFNKTTIKFKYPFIQCQQSQQSTHHPYGGALCTIPFFLCPQKQMRPSSHAGPLGRLLPWGPCLSWPSLHRRPDIAGHRFVSPTYFFWGGGPRIKSLSLCIAALHCRSALPLCHCRSVIAALSLSIMLPHFALHHPNHPLCGSPKTIMSRLLMTKTLYFLDFLYLMRVSCCLLLHGGQSLLSP